LSEKKQKKQPIEETKLGAWEGVLYGIGCGIGGSIFVLLGTAISQAGPGIIISLGLGGFLIFLTALNYSELSTSIPYSGGAYNFSKEALGGFLAYIIGFFLWLANIGTCVFSALAFSVVLGEMFPFLNILNNPFLINSIAILIILFICIVIFRTQKIAIRTLILFTAILIGIFILFIIVGTLITPIIAPNIFEPNYIFTDINIFGVINMFALLFISFTSITSNLAYLNPNLKNRAKNIPRINIIAILSTIIIYVFVSFVALINLGPNPSQLPDTEILLAGVFSNILGPVGFYVMAGAALLSTSVAMNAALGSAMSVLQALSRDKYITDKLSYVNKKTSVPIYSLVVTASIAILITIIVNINVAAEMTSFIYFFGLAFVNFATVSLRYKRKELDRPFKAPLFPYLPLVVGGACMILAFYLSTIAIVIGLILFIIGFGYYLISIADRHSIFITLAGIKFIAVIIIGILIWILKNASVTSSVVLNGTLVFNNILMRIMIFVCIFAIGTILFDIIPLREMVYYFVKKIDKDRVAINIGVGQIIELEKQKIKTIYLTNLVIGIIELIGSVFTLTIGFLVLTDIFIVEQMQIGSIVLPQQGSEYVIFASFFVFGLSLLFSSIVLVYYNRELKQFRI
jgi:APA family basic amino acid/polyamine antiporter